MAITSGTYRFEAYHVLPDSPQMQQDFLFALASIAARSQDPLARELVRIAKTNNLLPSDVTGFQEFPGSGMGALVTLPHENRPRPILLGTRAFLEESGLQIPDILEAAAQKWEKEKDALVWLAGWDAWVRGVLKFVSGT